MAQRDKDQKEVIMSQDSDAVVPLYRRPLFWVLLAALVLLALVLLVLLATRPAPAAPPPVDDGSSVAAVDCGRGAHFALDPGQKAFVKAGCRVSGDVAVGPEEEGLFTPLYDNLASTGLIVDMKSDGWILAAWGASVNTDSVKTWTSNMKRAGCDGQCKTVTVVEYWRSDQ